MPTLFLRVEPSECEARISAELSGGEPASRTEPMMERQLPNAITIVRLEFVFAGVAAEEPATQFTGFAAGVMRRAEAEIVVAILRVIAKALPIADSIPLRLAAEILRLTVDRKVIKVGNDMAAGDAGREDTEC